LRASILSRAAQQLSLADLAAGQQAGQRQTVVLFVFREKCHGFFLVLTEFVQHNRFCLAMLVL
jgi:hypothetical protein